jgi:ubiquinone/menaquinone biosynthesis C-methylase UbiE
VSTDLNEVDVAREEARIKSAYQKERPAGYYSCFNPGNLFVMQERERLLLRKLQQHGRGSLVGARILEVGCGSGQWLREFIKWGALASDITGVDLRSEALSSAAQMCPPGVTFQCVNGIVLDFPDESFDVVLQSLVFTSVLDKNMQNRMAHEMLRVVKRSGLILWYDFHVNNPWNPNVRGVRKSEIKELFPNCVLDLERVTLLLPLVKILAPWSWISCQVLSRLRILNTHYLGVIKKK